MHYVVVRESQPEDNPAIAEVVRNAYTSTVSTSYMNALYNEATFQIIVLLAAFMFIFMGCPIEYCLLSIPIVLIMIYVFIYGALLIKSAELIHTKRALKTWVAESYEPLRLENNDHSREPFVIISEERQFVDGIEPKKYLKKMVVGTVAVGRHRESDQWAWMFRLAVDRRYRCRGVGGELIRTAQSWCRTNDYTCLDLAMSECQEGARPLFNANGCVTCTRKVCSQVHAHYKCTNCVVTLKNRMLSYQLTPLFCC